MGSPNAAFSFLIETLTGIVLTIVILRILLEAVRADWYNPICQGLIKITDPLVKPLGKLIPRAGAINVAAIVVLFVIQLIGLIVLFLINGFMPDALTLIVVSIRRLVRQLLVIYLIMIIAVVIISWVGQNARHPIIPLLFKLTDPILLPIRRVLPDLGGFDLSPLIALIGIQFLIILLGV
ncbi:MAG: YggT family protein [Pseudomonadota bacterium]